MGAYMYPIVIDRKKQTIRFDENIPIDKDSLTLADLTFVGDDAFSIQEKEWGGYDVSVCRTRKETDEEQARRIAREESYMVEYNKRRGITPA